MCSLIESFHSIYYEPDSLNRKALGKAVSEVSQNLMTSAPKDISASGCDNIDVTYDNLIRDPKGTVKSIYAKFNWSFTPVYDSILDAFIKADCKKRENQKNAKTEKSENLHDYSPENYGLTPQELSQGVYADYIKLHNLSPPKNSKA